MLRSLVGSEMCIRDRYKVFRKYGLTDSEIRAWFNGPAFLTWSRGQNEYGNGIAGPLPRSWMKQQWEMQQLIVARHRSLGMYGQLPGFQGNVPVGLKQVQGDGNITSAAATGWMNSVDPLYGKIADTWMEEMIADFGTDSWYQLDGYFNGGTAPWYVRAPVDCVWSTEASDTYLPGCDEQCKSVQDLAQAKQACAADLGCGGITAKGSTGPWQLRSGSSGQHSSTGEVSWSITNTLECHPLRDDGSWFQRGAAAYQGLNRTDPQAIWSFQGWAFVGWNSREQAVSLKSFIDATPPGKFNVIDMSVNGDGEWKKWDNSSFWGANFVWTTLHDFGGTDGLKGRLDRINQIPFDAQDLGATVWGTGFTPEGIDQNPVYYEFMLEANWRTEPVADIEQHIVDRAHRRYGLTVVSEQVTTAWKLLVSSAYSQDLSVQDGTGVAHLGAAESWAFEPDRRTPSATMCQIYNAWLQLIEVADSGQVSLELETFRYDLINTGREVLAQLAGPFGQNFSDVTQSLKIDANLVSKLGELYSKVLIDLDTLVGTDKAFLLGPWLEAAKLFATDPKATDCIDTGYETIVDCARFYEWNARVQLTTWNPTPKLADKIPGGPIDYAAKHWSGLIKDYYATRVNLLTQQAIKDSGKTLNTTSWDRIQAGLAYNWTTDTKAYPTQPVGDPLQISKQIKLTYANFFTTC
eukprot:TRINITY_DN3647_c0_g1_i2.p1 TRINITY_DN3647_c0_g1~~TRINITY_DN3647_c0_g1_i2.p1  ORF type:complete len:691 (+),score=111.68 TRINITY_DN3647_c0_g1_i2:158-2230(+)